MPTALNGQLLAGELDVAPISSIEYARHADRLRILPRLCVSSEGAVDSIQLVSKTPLEHVRTVAVTPESATSVVLTKVLLPEATHVPLGEPAEAKLLIGDAALKSAFEDPTPHYDLGRLWLERTGLPMVFAVWAAPEPAPTGCSSCRTRSSPRCARRAPSPRRSRYEAADALRLSGRVPRALLREAALLVRAARARRAADVPRARARGRRARPRARAAVRRAPPRPRSSDEQASRAAGLGSDLSMIWLHRPRARRRRWRSGSPIAVFKWLFILAIVAAVIWFVFYRGRERTCRVESGATP